MIRFRVRYKKRQHKRQRTRKIEALNNISALGTLGEQIRRIPGFKSIDEVRVTRIDKPKTN